MSCLQKFKRRGQKPRFGGIKSGRYKLFWSGNDVGIGRAGISV